MSNEILVNVTLREVRVALIEAGLLQEIFIERAYQKGLVGNLYKGVVSRVLPGLQAAFVDLGLSRTAFLHFSDFSAPPLAVKNGEDLPIESTMNPPTLPNLKEGDVLLVQVIKDPISGKGARITTQISIPSRYLVILPDVSHVGISQRIEDDSERQRLKNLIQNQLEPDENLGFIVRTAAEGISEEALLADVFFLRRLWHSTLKKFAESPPMSTIHEDLPAALRVVRDLFGPSIDQVRIDHLGTYQELVQFAEKFMPESVSRISYYDQTRPIFDVYHVEEELQKALARKVYLKSGGYLVIDQTEAMTTIDVNTGGYVGHNDCEETVLNTNLEATEVIARQLRLRNLAGIILIDFIDMERSENREKVLAEFKKCLENDRAKKHLSEISALGLLEMTRKRARESLTQLLCEVCPTCGGRGRIKTTETVIHEIFRQVARQGRLQSAQKLLILAAPNVVHRLMETESAALDALALRLGKPIQVQPESFYWQEHYEVLAL